VWKRFGLLLGLNCIYKNIIDPIVGAKIQIKENRYHGRQQRGAGGLWPLWIFKHGKNIVGA